MQSYKIDPQDFQKVCEILTNQGLHARENGNKTGMEFPHTENSGSKIIIYKKTGTVQFQGKQDLLAELQELWENSASHLVKSGVLTKQSQNLVYFIPIEQISDLQLHIEALQQEYSVKNDLPNKISIYGKNITDNNSNKVKVTQYSKEYRGRGAKLLFQGIESELWNNVAHHIAEFLDANFETEVAKVMVTVQSDEELDVLNIVTSADKIAAEDSVKNKMGASYGFLSDYERDLIESSEYLLHSGVQPKNYFSVVSGTILAFEGYLKQLLIKIGACRQSDVNKDWKFSSVHLNTQPIKLIPSIERLLSNDSVSKNKKIAIVCKLIQTIYNQRNPNFHITPGSATPKFPNHKSANNVHEELIRLMSTSYNLLQEEISS